MPNWLFAIPIVWFLMTAGVKFAKSKGNKIVALGDIIIALGFTYQVVFPETYTGFIIAGAGVVIDLWIYTLVVKKEKQRKAKEEGEKKE